MAGRRSGPASAAWSCAERPQPRWERVRGNIVARLGSSLLAWSHCFPSQWQRDSNQTHPPRAWRKTAPLGHVRTSPGAAALLLKSSLLCRPFLRGREAAPGGHIIKVGRGVVLLKSRTSLAVSVLTSKIYSHRGRQGGVAMSYYKALDVGAHLRPGAQKCWIGGWLGAGGR